jgi:hypothetical protein
VGVLSQLAVEVEGVGSIFNLGFTCLSLSLSSCLVACVVWVLATFVVLLEEATVSVLLDCSGSASWDFFKVANLRFNSAKSSFLLL